jgi:hypothetical protein
MRVGEMFVKSLPYETDPEFTDVFLDMNERCPA